ncbi:Ldh family oxidoreductase [Pseudomonas typographi]|uniref:Ldh family oxidoreductase n=1 Tax=Pseudomonas typographi TaxID=2715964 RepID=A0ABR7Z187_9PSED|nr:Ldh family oxidoreductase [Pseudomonas typographi]MBD1554608.1 Ldh family oxidoreductase [Pseudomonas typographi]MBD1589725.1 Ldh family oxidoreductase [Pseudomonas typographi]MBD1599202.1 Ldh family oxidoreductase [Pseudomonas typographi]
MTTGSTARRPRFAYAALQRFSMALLGQVGLPADQAHLMTLRMLDADLLGHRTHGLWFLSSYLQRLEAGHIRADAPLEVIASGPASFAWRANRLPGAWVMDQATQQMLAMAATQAVVTATIADCSHIGCLQSYLLPLVEANLFVTLSATNPGIASVAPFGGIDAVLTSNPIAYGIPTSAEPILIDQCTSIASNSFFTAFAERGEKLPGAWLLDAQGQPSDDPAVLQAKPAGTILPLGGTAFGYKGFGLGIAVEALSLGLSGAGRLTGPDMYGQSVFLQVINPVHFAGLPVFLAEMDHLVAACRASRVRDGAPPVRLPGERALAQRREQMQAGIELSEEVFARLRPWASKFDIELPAERAA